MKKRDLRAYQTYLNALRLEHESSFIDENQDAQLALNAEIETVEEHIEELKRQIK
jgi:hypothetical protein